MAKKKEEKIDLNNIPEEEKIKYEIAGELGLLDKWLEKPVCKGNGTYRRAYDKTPKRTAKNRRKLGKVLDAAWRQWYYNQCIIP